MRSKLVSILTVAGLAVAGLTFAGLARAQVAPQTSAVARMIGPPKAKVAHEVVITAAGKTVPPWKEVQVCIGKTTQCKTALVNLETHEMARVDGKLSTAFEVIGRGPEVRRTGSVKARPIRLRGPLDEDVSAPPAPTTKPKE